MTIMSPYLLISLLAVLIFLAIVIIIRSFRKNLSLLAERIDSLEDALEKTKIAIGDEHARNTDEINHSARQLKEEIRSAMQSSFDAVAKKISENDSAYRSRLESLNSKFTALERKVQEESSALAEKAQAAAAAEAQAKPAARPTEDANTKARRLARLIVSDIALYNRKNVENGVRDGNFYELLAHEVREARALYERRVPEDIRNTTAYLDEAFAELILKTRRELNL